MDLSNNEINLLFKLLAIEEYKSASEFADELNISRRSIYSYLDNINDFMDIYNFDSVIIKKPGKGIKLFTKREELNFINRVLEIILNYKNNHLLFDRKIHIYWSLLNNIKISYKIFSEKYHVSKSTIYSDIKWLKNNYIPEGIKIVHDSHGTSLQGNETIIQSEIIKVLESIYSNIFGEKNELHSIAYFINVFYPDSKKISKEVQKTIELLGKDYEISDNYKVQLFKNLVVFLTRKIQGQEINKNYFYIIDEEIDKNIKEISNNIILKFERIIKTKFYSTESNYINGLLIACGISSKSSALDKTMVEKSVKSIISNLSKIINVNLSNDIELYNGLVNHITLMIYRIRSLQYLKNPYIQKIKKQYALMFYLTSIVVKEIEEEFNITLSEDEIAFITVYFQLSFERNSNPKIILILSDGGIVGRELLERRISEALSGMTILENKAFSTFNIADLQRYDFILSTKKLEYKDKKIIYLNEYPNDAELEKVQMIISNELSKTNTNKNYKPEISNLLNDGIILISNIKETQNDVITNLLKKLNPHLFIDKNAFIDSVFAREKLSSTSFDTHIALPHGDPKYVKKSSISLYLNKKSIPWGEHRVNIIILLSFSYKDINKVGNIMTSLYNLISVPEKIFELLNLNTSDQIINYIEKNVGSD